MTDGFSILMMRNQLSDILYLKVQINECDSLLAVFSDYVILFLFSSIFLPLVQRDGSSRQWTVDYEYGKGIWAAVHLHGYQGQFMHVLESFQHPKGLGSLYTLELLSSFEQLFH